MRRRARYPPRRVIAALPMYDWPEVADDVDRLWTAIARELRERRLDAPSQLTRHEDLESVWRDPGLLVGQVCSLNPVRDGDDRRDTDTG